MPTIRIDTPELLPALLESLRSQADIVAQVAGDDTILVSILGSYDTAHMRMATYLRVRAWETAMRSQGIELHVDIL